MKIGSKFLSSAVVGGKPATSATAAILTVGESDVPSSHGHAQQRRGSSNKVHVGPDLVGTAESDGRAHSGSIDWETQRHNSQGNLLIKPPPPPPPPSSSLLGSKESTGGKRASFSSTAKGGDGAESKLLAGKHRLSFALPRSSAPTVDMFDRGRGRGDPWEEEGEDAGLMATGNARRKSLLSKLQEEVLEEISGDELRLSQQDIHMAGSRGDLASPEHNAGDEPEDDGEDEPDAPSEDDEDELPPRPEDGSEGSPPPSDGEDEPEEDPEDEPAPPVRPSVRPGPPPPPPPPPPMKSALSDGLLGALKGGAAGSGLKKVDAPAEPKMDERTQLLRSIQLGSVQLKSNAAKPKPFQKIEVKVRVKQSYVPLCCSGLTFSASFPCSKTRLWRPSWRTGRRSRAATASPATTRTRTTRTMTTSAAAPYL
jgi:hypothetical protein